MAVTARRTACPAIRSISANLSTAIASSATRLAACRHQPVRRVRTNRGFRGTRRKEKGGRGCLHSVANKKTARYNLQTLYHSGHFVRFRVRKDTQILDPDRWVYLNKTSYRHKRSGALIGSLSLPVMYSCARQIKRNRQKGEL